MVYGPEVICVAPIGTVRGDVMQRVVGWLREAFGLPVVVGRISDSGRDEDGTVWTHGDIVRAAQAAFVEGDAAAALVTTTDEYAYSDPWHYDSRGYIDLGRRFAEAVFALEQR